ncbi:MAG: hypothetical protein P9L97_11005 [Candidatus Tenebribacter davisii]|jgi:hypothetical protein|nr:hypothetical protein [Candidatus Tenebribacter davisii]
MKIRLVCFLVILSVLIVSCSSTDVEKISFVTVNQGDDPYEVELSHSVVIPITKSGAIFIMEECLEEYNSAMGDPELIDEFWVFSWSPEYPVFEIKVKRSDGDVFITLFG